MNIVNPTIFDNILWPDGKRYTPFIDVYDFAAGSVPISGLDILDSAALRDYTVCQNISLLLDINPGSDLLTNYYSLPNSGGIGVIEPQLETVAPNCQVKIYNTSTSGAFAYAAFKVRVTGFAPIS